MKEAAVAVLPTRTSVAVALAVVGVAPSAHAAEARVSSEGRVSYRAAPGEANRVVITEVGVERPTLIVRIADAGAPVVAGPGCVAEAPSRVVCTGPAGWGPVALGDRDDELTTATSSPVGRVDAGAGDDRVTGDIEVQHGDAGADILTAGSGPASLFGGPGGDTLVGGPGYDVLAGGGGDDEFRPGSFDRIDYSDHAAAVTVDLEAGTGGSRGERDRIVDVPVHLRVIGSDRDDVLLGSPADDQFEARAGDDEVRGFDGDDLIEAGPGDDVLVGGLDADFMNGEAGFDVVDYSDHVYRVDVHLGGSTFSGGVEDRESVWSLWSDQLQMIEGGIGGDGDDALTGGQEDNVLAGGPGADSITGGGGFDYAVYADHDVGVTADLDTAGGDDGAPGEHDTVWFDVEGLVGGNGADSLTGNGAQNHLVGGPGDDRLDGGAYVDVVDGDEGGDVIASRDGAPDMVRCGADVDTVTADPSDEVGDCEHVDLPPATANETAPAAPSSPVVPSTPPQAKPSGTVSRPRRRPLVVRVGRVRVLRARVVAVRVPCPAVAAGRCRTTVTLMTRLSKGARTAKVGSATVAVRRGRAADVRIALRPAARLRLAGGGALVGTLTVTVRDAEGRRVTTRRTVTLRLPATSRPRPG